MSDNKKKNLIMGIALGQLALAVVFMILGVMRKNMTTLQGNILVGASIFLYWLLMDVVDTKVRHVLDDLSAERKNAYYRYALLDLAGLAGIVIFLFCMGGSNSTYSILGAALYAFTMKPKKDAQDLYLGVEKPEQSADETDAAEVEAESEQPVQENETVDVGEQADTKETEGAQP